MKYSLIISDLLVFVEIIYKRGIQEAKKSKEYILYSDIISGNAHSEIAYYIPKIVLFDEDIDDYTHILYNYKYDENIKCFIFKDINECFYGCKNILRLMCVNFPEIEYLREKKTMIDYAITMIENYEDMDTMFDKMSNVNLS